MGVQTELKVTEGPVSPFLLDIMAVAGEAGAAVMSSLSRGIEP
jgi:hypothetical protein